jgi:hypothetical protein
MLLVLFNAKNEAYIFLRNVVRILNGLQDVVWQYYCDENL